MKELLTLSSNFYAAFTDTGAMIPQVEIILVMSEPAYHLNVAGELEKRREASQVRFASYPSALRELASALIKLADESDELMPKK